jgi:beta-barrel assembly-enhancing protease
MKWLRVSRIGCRSVFLIWLIISFLGVNCFLSETAVALTLSDENTIGREMLKMIRAQLSLVEDGEVLAYVQAVGNRIARQLGSTPYRYQFFVINQSVPNAFAVPGGYIFIYRGLIEMMSSEGELAGILSHEMGHIQARHYQRRAEEGHIFNVATIAGMLAAVLIGAKGGGSAAQALMMGTMAGATTMQLKYSRENEEEADQMGLRYLVGAGYPAKDMVTVMQRLNQAQWMANSNIPSYLLTHPALSERIQYLQDLVNKPEYQQKAGQSSSLGDFSIMQAALVSEYADPHTAEDRFRAGVHKGDAAALYGLGRLYLRQGKVAEAMPYLQDAARQDSGSPFVLSTLGDGYLKQGKLKEAQKALQTALLLDPSSPVAHFRLALVLKEQGQKDEALQHLERIEGLFPAFPDIDYNLGILYGQTDRLGLAHFHLGRFYLHRYDWDAVVFHYRKARPLLWDSPQKLEEVDRGLKEAEKHLKDKALRGMKK